MLTVAVDFLCYHLFFFVCKKKPSCWLYWNWSRQLFDDGKRSCFFDEWRRRSSSYALATPPVLAVNSVQTQSSTNGSQIRHVAALEQAHKPPTPTSPPTQQPPCEPPQQLRQQRSASYGESARLGNRFAKTNKQTNKHTNNSVKSRETRSKSSQTY